MSQLPALQQSVAKVPRGFPHALLSHGLLPNLYVFPDRRHQFAFRNLGINRT